MAGSGPGTGRRWRLVRSRQLRGGRVGARVRAGVLRWWLTGLLVLVVAGAGGWILLGTSVLAVRTVEVSGSTVLSADQIRATAGVALGTPLARVDTGAVEARLRALPPVADVDVSRSWPSTLVITVTERKAVAAVVAGHRFRVLDGSGVVFNSVPVLPAGAVLLVLTSPGPDDPATRSALTVVAALTPQLRAVLKQVVVSSPVNIRLDLLDGRYIVWGDAGQSARKALVATDLLGRATTRIDVSAPDVIAVS